MRIRRLLDILVPRFLTEDAAVMRCPDPYCRAPHIVCSMTDVGPHEVFDGIVTVRGFNLFGFLLFARLVGDVRPFVNPHWGAV